MSLPLVVGISGASGVVLAVRLLEVLKSSDVPAHLIISRPAIQTLKDETDLPADAVRALAAVNYPNGDITAAVASGSFRTRGMIIVPCSARTLADVAHGGGDTLIARAADVTLKERRRLVLVVRETPLHAGHIRNMLAATENGAIIMPPMPAFYTRPQSVDDIVDQTVGRALDLFDIDPGIVKRWPGDGDAPTGNLE
jgi:4-hydroxy-3-polyprenylbenzoate decarboxylase